MLRLDTVRRTYSAEIKHRTFGRIHLRLHTKVKTVAMTRHTALQQLLDTGEPVRALVEALRKRKLTIQAVEECVRAKRPFDALLPSTWPTLADATAQYLKTLESQEKTAASTIASARIALNHAIAHFGGASPIEAITFDQVSAFRDYLRSQGHSSNTVALNLIKFGALFTFLQKRETRRALQQKRHPAVLFSPLDRDEHVPDKVKTRVRFLVEAEAQQMLEATPPDYTLAVALGLFAGLRFGEVETLRPFVDVDAERSVIYVQAREGWTPKYRKNREVPISSALEPYLTAHLARLPANAPYLFGGRSDDSNIGRTKLRYVFRRVVTDSGLEPGRAKLEGVTFHTLRHTFASWLVMAGADLFTVARLMGHSSTKQLEETYAHLSPQHRLATVELLSARWLKTQLDTAGDTAK